MRSPKRGRCSRSAVQLFHPRLESCEDRLLPSTFTVIDLGDTGSGSGLRGDLRYAINTANSNTDLSNHIVFQPGLTGTVTLVQGTLLVSKPLELSGPGAGLLTVSGNHQSGVFDIEAPAGQTVILADLTITGGTGSGVDQLGKAAGGGLFNDSATLILNRTTITGNTLPPQGDGGGLFNFHGDVSLTSSTVSDNHVDGPYSTPDGIANLGTMTLSHSTVSGNSESEQGTDIQNGGTMTLDHCVIAHNQGNIFSTGSLTITNCTINNNVAVNGTALTTGSPATITDSTITDNFATISAGAISHGVGDLTISRCTIARNSALVNGGIVSVGGAVYVSDSTISGNQSPYGRGGGIDFEKTYGGFVEITGSTITLNSAQSAGGVYSAGSGMLIRSSIIAGNPTGPFQPDVVGTVLSLGHNLVGAIDSSSNGWAATDLTGNPVFPLDPMLGPLQDNGGLTLTHALLSGSPALNAGDTGLFGSFDQRGTLREYSVVHGVDIGAFQTEDAVSFRLVAPSQVIAGVPFNVTVLALDQWGNTASTYTGTVHFSSTDLFAQLPDDTAFSGDDAGSHTFSVTLKTPGTQEIKVVDSQANSIAGNVSVDVADNPVAFRASDLFGYLFSGDTAAGSGYLRRRHGN
jgi:hypothetical protein